MFWKREKWKEMILYPSRKINCLASKWGSHLTIYEMRHDYLKHNYHDFIRVTIAIDIYIQSMYNRGGRFTYWCNIKNLFDILKIGMWSIIDIFMIKQAKSYWSITFYGWSIKTHNRTKVLGLTLFSFTDIDCHGRSFKRGCWWCSAWTLVCKGKLLIFKHFQFSIVHCP